MLLHTVVGGIAIIICRICNSFRILESVVGGLADRVALAGSEIIRGLWIATTQTELNKLMVIVRASLRQNRANLLTLSVPQNPNSLQQGMLCGH